MTKAQIRAKMRAFMLGLTPEDLHKRSQAACALLAGTKEFRQAQSVMLYLTMTGEVEITPLALKAWSEGKSIALPRIEWDGQKMEALEVTSLESGIQTIGPGVRQPMEGRVVPLDSIDLVVVPGLAFDRRGYRVGRGKGFYDRFLAQQEFRGTRVALCFHEQLMPMLPSEPHDMPMHLVVTDTEVIHCGGHRN